MEKRLIYAFLYVIFATSLSHGFSRRRCCGSGGGGAAMPMQMPMQMPIQMPMPQMTQGFGGSRCGGGLGAAQTYASRPCGAGTAGLGAQPLPAAGFGAQARPAAAFGAQPGLGALPQPGFGAQAQAPAPDFGAQSLPAALPPSPLPEPEPQAESTQPAGDREDHRPDYRPGHLGRQVDIRYEPRIIYGDGDAEAARPAAATTSSSNGEKIRRLRPLVVNLPGFAQEEAAAQNTPGAEIQVLKGPLQPVPTGRLGGPGSPFVMPPLVMRVRRPEPEPIPEPTTQEIIHTHHHHYGQSPPTLEGAQAIPLPQVPAPTIPDPGFGGDQTMLPAGLDGAQAMPSPALVTGGQRPTIVIMLGPGTQIARAGSGLLGATGLAPGEAPPGMGGQLAGLSA